MTGNRQPMFKKERRKAVHFIKFWVSTSYKRYFFGITISTVISALLLQSELVMDKRGKKKKLQIPTQVFRLWVGKYRGDGDEFLPKKAARRTAIILEAKSGTRNRLHVRNRRQQGRFGCGSEFVEWNLGILPIFFGLGFGGDFGIPELG